MTAYKSVVGEATAEQIIEKSRFLTYVAHTESEDEAKAYLAKVRGLHPLATHVCFAYIADRTGNLQRFSDDGEPQGTAGMPILNVLKARGLAETTAAVVRYFGGIKLGAGGLTRAYASSAADGCAAAETRLYELCAELEISVGYPEVNAVLRFLEGRELLSRSFSEKAAFTVAVKAGESEKFRAELCEYLNGKAEIVEKNRYFYAFPLEKSQ